jgi:hypothetical protein
LNQKLSDWASIAEIVSGVAVLVTLIILILGINENTAVTRVSVYGDLIGNINDWERDLYQDPELTRLLGAWIDSDVEALSASDIARLRLIVDVMFRNYEKAFFYEREEVIDEVEWSRFERNICISDARSKAFGIDYRYQEVLNERFVEHIASSCDP